MTDFEAFLFVVEVAHLHVWEVAEGLHQLFCTHAAHGSELEGHGAFVFDSRETHRVLVHVEQLAETRGERELLDVLLPEREVENSREAIDARSLPLPSRVPLLALSVLLVSPIHISHGTNR